MELLVYVNKTRSNNEIIIFLLRISFNADVVIMEMRFICYSSSSLSVK